jgi:GT2 family glycosyltransferase
VSADRLTFGLAIPAYKNVEALRTCLQAALRASPSLTANCVVVDDSGNGHVWQILQREFSYVHWVVHEQNAGFGRSATEAVALCKADVVVLLNDDVEIIADPLPHLERAFADDSLFAATFKSLHEDGTLREGAKRLAWPLGFPRILHNERDQRPATGDMLPSDYAVGGHAAYHRRRFLELHGFDALFEPFYWEDVDLCVRARQRGWCTIYLPECVVTHGAVGTIRDLHKEAYVREITLRNRLLFAGRHCLPALRPLLALSIYFQNMAAKLSGDTIFPSALRTARERAKAFSNSSPQNFVR